ncbi:MAG: hypothetical protein R2697_07630 [Ilumatobacteraceae bacterium]
MFEGNILTFNLVGARKVSSPATTSPTSTDAFRRAAAGIEPVESTDSDGTGPAHIVVTDPDGNTVMVDQHRPPKQLTRDTHRCVVRHGRRDARSDNRGCADGERTSALG